MNLMDNKSIATSPIAILTATMTTPVTLMPRQGYLRKGLWGAMAVTAIALTACSTTPTISSTTPQRPVYVNGVPSFHIVRSGDTVSKIATRYRLDYRQIGALNGLDSNYTIHVGQRLLLLPRSQVNQATRAITPSRQTNTPVYQTTRPPVYQAPSYQAPAPIVTGSQQNWLRPVNGNLVRSFNQSGGVMGNWYSSSQGAPVMASQSGTVMYVGSDLPEYGKLVLIQHSNDLITAYAHLNSFNVQEKQTVQAGQQIGTVGYVSSLNQPALEFQVRLRGTPVNPSNYIR